MSDRRSIRITGGAGYIGNHAVVAIRAGTNLRRNQVVYHWITETMEEAAPRS